MQQSQKLVRLLKMKVILIMTLSTLFRGFTETSKKEETDRRD